jgi:predicted ATPase
VLEQLEQKVMPQFDGERTVNDSWLFSSSTAAVWAADELFRLSDEKAFVTVFTGEADIDNALPSALSERAYSACDVLKRPGVYTCAATAFLAADGLPADLWLIDAGHAPLQSGGIERLFMLCRGSMEPNTAGLFDLGRNIPKLGAVFVGREEEIERIGEMLVDQFMVTITGLSGVGKSAVAARVARAAEGNNDDGVFWIDVGKCKTQKELVDSLCRATQAGRTLREESMAALAQRIKDWSALIVFDNCEKLAEEVRDIATTLLSASVRLGVLATSIKPLNVRQEQRFALPALSVPVPGAEHEELNRAQSEAVWVFVERAILADSNFKFNFESVGPVADICRALDGHPLAIEIAAEKLAGRSLATLHRQVEKINSLKKSSFLRPHHVSIKQAMAHSLGIVPEEYGRLLADLCVYSGAFTNEQAVLVDAGTMDEAALSEALGELVRASLLVFDGASGRYVVPRLLKSFLQEQQDFLPKTGPARMRFCKRMFAIVDESARRFSVGDESGASLLDGYIGHIEEAIGYACHTPELHGQIRDVLITLPSYWARRNRLPEVDHLLSAIMENVDVGPALRADCLVLTAVARIEYHDYDAAETILLQALSAAEESQSKLGLQRAYGNLALVYEETGRYAEAVEYCDRALLLAREDGSRVRILSVLCNFAATRLHWLETGAPESLRAGLWADAVDDLTQAESLVRAEELFWVSTIQSIQANLSFNKGDFESAKRGLIASALTCERGGFSFEAASGLELLAQIYASENYPREATKLVGLAVSLRIKNQRPRKQAYVDRFEQLMRALRATLGEEAFTECSDYGASLAISDLCVLT